MLAASPNLSEPQSGNKYSLLSYHKFSLQVKLVISVNVPSTLLLICLANVGTRTKAGAILCQGRDRVP